MFKVLKEFILANGFKCLVGQEHGEDKFLPHEVDSLVADGSLEKVGKESKVEELVNEPQAPTPPVVNADQNNAGSI